MKKMVELTDTILVHCGSAGHGWSNYQIALLGETPTKGWKSRVIGKEFSIEIINELYRTMGVSSKKAMKSGFNEKQPSLFDL